MHAHFNLIATTLSGNFIQLPYYCKASLTYPTASFAPSRVPAPPDTRFSKRHAQIRYDLQNLRFSEPRFFKDRRDKENLSELDHRTLGVANPLSFAQQLSLVPALDLGKQE